MDIAPTEFYRRAFKKGMQGWEVAALQIALNSHSSRDVAVDGVFGPLLEALVVQEQKNHHLIVDGVLGVATQRAILTVEAHAAEKAHSLPVGLLVGLTEGESGYVIPAASSSPLTTWTTPTTRQPRSSRPRPSASSGCQVPRPPAERSSSPS
jgi:peptidoglycan hydrolase-like protein with peptidoglycan-binding domain